MAVFPPFRLCVENGPVVLVVQLINFSVVPSCYKTLGGLVKFLFLLVWKALCLFHTCKKRMYRCQAMLCFLFFVTPPFIGRGDVFFLVCFCVGESLISVWRVFFISKFLLCGSEMSDQNKTHCAFLLCFPLFEPKVSRGTFGPPWQPPPDRPRFGRRNPRLLSVF